MRKVIEFIVIIILMCGIIAGAVDFAQIESYSSLANLSNVFSGLGWFLGAFAAALLLTAYLVVIAPARVILRFLAIPAWIIFSVSLLVTVDQFMGYSYPSLPPQATVIAYHVLKDENKVKTIEAWMWLRDKGKARAYNFQWTQEREEALKEGQRGAQNGEPVEVDLAPSTSGMDGKLSPMVIYNWDMNANDPAKEQAEPMSSSTQGGVSSINDGRDRDSNGEIEILDPAAPVSKKNDWDDLSHPGF